MTAPIGPLSHDAIPTTPPVKASPERARMALIVLSVMGFAVVTNEILPFGLITLMSEDLGTSEAKTGLLVTGFAAVVVLCSVPIALTTRAIPRRYLLTAAAALWTVGLVTQALSDDFAQLVVGRGITAVAHSAYWAVAVAAAADLFPVKVRGRVVTRVLVGTAIAGVMGLPVGVWFGQQVGWRAPYFVLAGLGVALAIAVALVLPTYRPSEGSASRGSHPSVRAFVRVQAILVIMVAGYISVFTYITPLLTDVAGISASAVPLVLMASAVLGVFAMLMVGRIVDASPRRAMAVGAAGLVVSWALLAFAASVAWIAVTAVTLVGGAWAVLVGTLLARATRHAPGSTDVAAATHASVFNVGAVVGSLLGAAVFASFGSEWLPLVGTVLFVAGTAVLVTEPRVIEMRPWGDKRPTPQA